MVLVSGGCHGCSSVASGGGVVGCGCAAAGVGRFGGVRFLDAEDVVIVASLPKLLLICSNGTAGGE